MYTAVNPNVDESQFDDKPIEDRVKNIAKLKAEKILDDYPEAFIIAADTLTQDVETGQIYSKPERLEAVRDQALSMSGRTVRNVTGTAIYHQGQILELALTSTLLTYQQFDAATYDRLTADDNPLRRSSVLGMFTDAVGFTLLECINGSYTGAMGLPMEVVYRNLSKIIDK